MLFKLCRCRKTIAVVHVDKHGNVVTNREWLELFVERQKKILGQAPVKKRPHPVHIHHFETGKLAQLNPRAAKRCNRHIIRVQVNKHLQSVAQPCTFRHLRFWQQDATFRATLKIHSKIHFTDHFQLVKAAGFDH